jgi:surfactin synthase thioesterase subunit
MTVKPQIFILHYAGGNVYSFQALADKLRSLFAVEALELPGRGRRIREPLLQTKKEAVADYLRQIRARRTNAPFMIFGHSMGATLGFNIVKELEVSGDAPVCFIASGNPGPNVKESKNYSQLPREEFFNALRQMGGITEELAANHELLEFFEPILRADFALLERKDEDIAYKINTPIFALMGSTEEYVQHIQNWGKYTRGGFEHTVLEGNHFFVFDHLDRLHPIIERAYHQTKTNA